MFIDIMDTLYIGCYKDTSDRALPFRQPQDAEMTISKCMKTCSDKGYTFCGLQFSTECYCGYNTYAKHGKVDEDECDSPCGGDVAKYCGGFWRASVYQAI